MSIIVHVFGRHMPSFFLDIHQGMELLSYMIGICLVAVGSMKKWSKEVETFYTSISNI